MGTLLRIALIGPFGLEPKMTMTRRALPLARALSGRGHAVRVILPPWDCPHHSGKAWQDGNLEVMNIRLPSGVTPLLQLSTALRTLLAALRFSPDVVHCFKPKAYSGLVAGAVWAMQRLGAWKGRLIVDTDDWEGRGGWNDVAGYSRWLRAFFSWQEGWGLTHCDAVTVASRWLERKTKTVRGSSEQVWYVPNGADVQDDDLPQPHDSSSPPGSLAGNWRPLRALLYTRFVEYDPSDVLAIWTQVLAMLPEAQLRIVGEGFRGESAELKQLVAQRGLGESVEVLGWVESERLPDAYEGADVVLMPVEDTILNRAKSPARLLDVMAAGKPVVAHAVGEYATLVEDGRTGLLVAPGDQASFAVAVARLLMDRSLGQAMGLAARRRIREFHVWSCRVAPLLEAYQAGQA